MASCPGSASGGGVNFPEAGRPPRPGPRLGLRTRRQAWPRCPGPGPPAPRRSRRCRDGLLTPLTLYHSVHRQDSVHSSPESGTGASPRSRCDTGAQAQVFRTRRTRSPPEGTESPGRCGAAAASQLHAPQPAPGGRGRCARSRGPGVCARCQRGRAPRGRGGPGRFRLLLPRAAPGAPGLRAHRPRLCLQPHAASSPICVQTLLFV